jgi:outer membrane receptor protein involved in Fe transport
MERNSRGMLAATTALCLLTSAGTAWGQQSTDAAELEASDVIVVTAQKRSENLQDVPISISVVGGERLRETGASQLTDFGAYVPGLQVDSSGTPGQSTISLRGIAPIGPSATVGTYVDDAPVGSSSLYARASAFALDLLPYDIERIEVLRGPQGTLYGASSIGGLLKYVTVTPSLTDFSGKAGAEVFGIRRAGGAGYAGQAMVNVPLVSDRLGLTASYAYRKTPGYVDSVVTGTHGQNDYRQQGARIALLWQASDDFSVALSGLWQEIESEGNGSVVEDIVTGKRIGNGFSNNNYLDEPFTKSLYYFAGTLKNDLGFATLSSTTTYSRVKTSQTQDASRIFGVLFPLFGQPAAGLAPFNITLDLKKVTQEVRLTSPSGGRFEWLLGGFFTNEVSGNKQIVRAYDMAGRPIAGLDPLAIAELPTRYREFAAFANATYKFSDRFDITAGLRWARNTQRYRQISVGAVVPTANNPGSSAESVLTYSVSPRFHLSDDTMLYVRVASGYRPGGPNATLPGVAPTVASDSLTNYETGLKTTLFNRTLTLDLAAFYMDWKDLQMTVDFNGVSGLANAGSARSQGFEATFSWRPVRGLKLGANGAFTDAKLTSNTPPAVGGLDGDRLPRIPKWSGSLTADYSFALGRDMQANLGAGLRHTGRRVSSFEGVPTVTNPIFADAYTALDFNAGITFNDRWSLRVYARNVADTDAAITRDVQTDGLGRRSYIRTTPLQPRTIALALDLSF